MTSPRAVLRQPRSRLPKYSTFSTHLFDVRVWAITSAELDFDCHGAFVSVVTERSTEDSGGLSDYCERVPNGPYIAEAASLIGDPTRANMLAALMGGEALTAKELTLIARVSPSTASEHLSKLLEGGLVTVTPGGRHRYYRLASPAVADVLERLMVLSHYGPPRHRPKSRCDGAMAEARTCYDHFAGKLGVAIADSLVKKGHVILADGAGVLTETGSAFMREIGADRGQAKASRRPLVRPCLDWSERRWHIGGAIGAALADRSFEANWVERRSRGRAVTVTELGQQAFERWFGFRVSSELEMQA